MNAQQTAPIGTADEFERCRGWLEAALDYAEGTHTIADIERMVGEGRLTLIPGQNCALVVEIIECPQKRALHIFLAGGDLAEIRTFDPLMVELAKAHNCQLVTIAGRKGWERELKNLGYHHSYSVVVKEVSL